MAAVLQACLLALWSAAIFGRPTPRACPVEPPPNGSPQGQEEVKLSIDNRAGAPLKVMYRDASGSELQMAILEDQEQTSYNSFLGHVFVLRAVSTSRIVHVVRVLAATSGAQAEVIQPCEGMETERQEVQLDSSRWAEFAALAAQTRQKCDEAQPSSSWSCVRTVTPEDLRARDPSLWGFTREEAKPTPYKQGTTTDHIFAGQQKYLVNVTAFEGGYLKLDMTEKLKELITFYRQKKASFYRGSIIPGYFTNNHIIGLDMLDIDPGLKNAVVREMKAVLEWWTQMRLRHTTTFGIRIYRRGSMLINHMDRKDSHLASAILQVAQSTDKDGGWPVEVIHPHKPGVREVYLQPGEMLLYEGARLAHGRPMRFRGEEFANVFSHFVPESYPGPDERWRNPFLDQAKAEL